jgi:CubicO group peptidase (beta-lactamase class C family)
VFVPRQFTVLCESDQSKWLKVHAQGERLRRAISVLFLGVVSSLVAQTKSRSIEPSKPDFTRIERYVQEHMAAESVPSVAIAVGRGGEILWEEGFGWADQENGIRATAYTPYFLASVTKSLTGTALMVLQERGKLDLDHPVNDYLGSARVHSPMWDPAQATVRRIANHTGGLTTYARACPLNDAHCQVSTNTAIERYGVLFWPPGDHFDYSNLGYGILGEVIARVSGRTYGDFLLDDVFQPLGMTDCALEMNEELRKRAAAQYDGTTHARNALYRWDTPGASSVRCSVHDLVGFGMFALNEDVAGQKAILSKASRNAMLNSTVDTGDGKRYGLGWWTNPDFYGYRVVFGAGGSSDSSAYFYTVPSEGIVVAVLANTGTLLPSKVVEEVLSQLLPGFRERREKAAEPAKSPAENSHATQPAAALEGKWTGEIHTWTGAVPLTLSISHTWEIHAKIRSQDGILQHSA